MDIEDHVMTEIGRAQELAVAGERDRARGAFEKLWEQVEEAGDPLHVVTLAHFAADVQDDPARELEWDLRALDAVPALTDARAQRHHPSLRVAGFLPSLHLNAAAAYAKLGNAAAAAEHLDRAQLHCRHLADDDYGRMIRDAITRLRGEIPTPGEGRGAHTC